MPDTFSHDSRTVNYYSRYRPRYPQAMLAWLKAIFDQHQGGGVVTLTYDTALVYGQLTA